MFLEVARPVRHEATRATPLAQLQWAFEMTEFDAEARQRREAADDGFNPSQVRLKPADARTDLRFALLQSLTGPSETSAAQTDCAAASRLQSLTGPSETPRADRAGSR